MPWHNLVMALQNAREIIDHAYRQTQTSPSELFSDSAERGAWELDNINVVTEFMYETINRLYDNPENMQTDVQDFYARDEGNEESNSTFEILDSDSIIKKIQVKYSESDFSVEATYIPSSQLQGTLEDLASGAFFSIAAPVYTKIGNDIYIFPKPAETVVNGAEMLFVTSVDRIDNLNETVTSIPGTQRRILYYGFMSKILERKGEFESSISMDRFFLQKIEESVNNLAIRTTNKRIIPTNRVLTP